MVKYHTAVHVRSLKRLETFSLQFKLIVVNGNLKHMILNVLQHLLDGDNSKGLHQQHKPIMWHQVHSLISAALVTVQSRSPVLYLPALYSLPWGWHSWGGRYLGGKLPAHPRC